MWTPTRRLVIGCVNGVSQNDRVADDFVLSYALRYYSCKTELMGNEVGDLTGLRTPDSQTSVRF
jgi:hypothetical protein